MTDHLFSPDYQEPPDTTTQVDRLPGSVDAPCLCDGGTSAKPFTTTTCLFPWCNWRERTDG
jgi:hypothetical protein